MGTDKFGKRLPPAGRPARWRDRRLRYVKPLTTSATYRKPRSRHPGHAMARTAAPACPAAGRSRRRGGPRRARRATPAAAPARGHLQHVADLGGGQQREHLTLLAPVRPAHQPAIEPAQRSGRQGGEPVGGTPRGPGRWYRGAHARHGGSSSALDVNRRDAGRGPAGRPLDRRGGPARGARPVRDPVLRERGPARRTRPPARQAPLQPARTRCAGSRSSRSAAASASGSPRSAPPCIPAPPAGFGWWTSRSPCSTPGSRRPDARGRCC
jgi:hypothetical protein